MTPLVCVPIMVRDAAQALREGEAARLAGADLVELRIDEVFEGEDDAAGERLVLSLVAQSPLPCIVTCRPVSEGGSYDGDEPSRISLFQRLATAFGENERPPRYLDVELWTYTRSANVRQKINLAVEHPEQVRDLTTSLILSSHDTDGRPADLTRRIVRMQEECAAKVLKIAYRARSLRDNIELFDLLAQRDRPMIALGMGEFGLISRLLAPKFGGFLTFASLRPEEVTAPGQPTIADLLGLYRFRSIKPSTAVYGIVGYPISHSVSPHVHNAGFEAIGHDGVYVPLPVPGGLEGGHAAATGGYENLKATVGELIDHPALNLRGASVTSPHKENLSRLAREMGWDIDEAALAVRAGNTLAIDRDAAGRPTRVRVANTDIPAITAVVREAVGDPAGKRIAVVGAGGMARAAVYGLVTSGARVLVFNRTLKRAQLLAESSRDLRPGSVEAMDIEEIPTCRCEVFIHCTTQGMAGGPAPGDIGIPIAPLRAQDPPPVIIETVYNPLATPLVKGAEAHGLRSVVGLSTFLRQASLQFELWTGVAPPANLFERVAREALASTPP